jgi:hypothetical protein
MPFVQGKTPAIIIPQTRIVEAVDALHCVGYTRHRGLRWTRENEVYTLRKSWSDYAAKTCNRRMQNHVQIVACDDGLHVFAHTEPAGYGLEHAVSAIMDKADFLVGSKILVSDLKRSGYKK